MFSGKLKVGKFSITRTHTFKVLQCSLLYFLPLALLLVFSAASDHCPYDDVVIVFVNHYWIKTLNHNALVRATKNILNTRYPLLFICLAPAILNDDQLIHEAKGNCCCCCCSTILLYRIATLLHRKKNGHFNW